MKPEKFGAKFSLVGYLLFLLPITLTVSLSILIFNVASQNIQNKWLVALFVVIFISIVTFLFSLIDIYRRRVMVDKPAKKILEATQKIAVGDFSVRLKSDHLFDKYDEYDLIMENINKMTEELSKSEILKTEFISNVSHEIKTPLSVIQNYAKALQGDLDKQTQNKYLQTLVLTSQKLSNLITNILKLNKLENQEIVPQKQKVDVSELLRECVLQFESKIEEKQIELKCNIVDIELNTEASFLEIIFNNLISNALKFTNPNGSVEITLQQQKNNVVFQVRDTGCGIDATFGKKIFEKFYQGDTSHSAEGNGLGLALVKRVIDILGGEISVESEINKGSTFTVILKKEYEQIL